MTATLHRSFGILEYLAAHPEGIALAVIADDLKIPRSACHRLLAELGRSGYVRSPYYPYNTIDVSGLPHGAKVMDPSTGRPFINP